MAPPDWCRRQLAAVGLAKVVPSTATHRCGGGSHNAVWCWEAHRGWEAREEEGQARALLQLEDGAADGLLKSEENQDVISAPWTWVCAARLCPNKAARYVEPRG